jgi:hypothetical protein
MKKRITIQHEFVGFIPSDLADRTLYISMEYGTAVHRCFCGCGEKVVTPLTPTDWKLTYNGESVWLHPSIGNWGFDCQSHYLVKGNRVVWANRWSQEEIAAGRAHDRVRKNEKYNRDDFESDQPLRKNDVGKSRNWISRIFNGWFR